MSRYIWIRGKRYYFYGNFSTWKDAYNTARNIGKKNRKNKYYIQVVEQGFLFPYKVYKLYMTHSFTLGVFG